MSQNEVDLTRIFQTVTRALAENQETLDQADEYNRDHGSNMVHTFQTITNSLQMKRGASDSARLKYAAKQLQKSTSGSGKAYAQNLAQAAEQFKGKKVDNKGALQLLQTLIGSSQTGPSAGQQGGDLMSALLGGLTSGTDVPIQPDLQSGGGDLMGALLAGLAGGQATATQPAQPSSGDDIMGALLSALAGGEVQTQPPNQQGSSDLLSALLTGLGGSGGFSSQQPPSQSGSNDLLGTLLSGLAGSGSSGILPALVQAFVSGSGMGRSAHRNQSTEVVVDSYLKALGLSGDRP